MMRVVGAVAAGLGVLVSVVIGAFVIALLSGVVGKSEGEIDLTGWLWVEVVAGGIGAVLAGWVCARVGRSRLPVLALAGLVLLLGAAETTEILLSDGVIAPAWLAILAPFVAAGAIVAGGRIGRVRCRPHRE